MKTYRLIMGEKIIEPIIDWNMKWQGVDITSGNAPNMFTYVKGKLENGKEFYVVSSVYHPIIIEEI